MCLYSHTTHSSNSIYPNFQLSQYNHPAYLTNHLVLLSPSLAVCPSQGGEGGGGGAAVTVAATLVSRHHLDQHWNRGDAGDFYPVHQHIRIDILVGWIEPILSTMPIKILFTSVSRRLFKAALRLKKTWFFFIQLKIIGDQGLGGNGKAASKKDLESEYKLWIRRNVNKGRMWGNNDILPLFRKWVVNILNLLSSPGEVVPNNKRDRLQSVSIPWKEEQWSFFFNLGSLPHHLNLSPITIGSHSPVWIR